MNQFDYHCPNCQHEYIVGVGVYTCPNCGQANNVTSESSSPKNKTNNHLITLANWHIILSNVLGVLFVLSFFVGCFHFINPQVIPWYTDPGFGISLMFRSVVGGFITVITLRTIGGVIIILVNIANDLSEVKILLRRP